ncbi:hypothetical protein R6Q59_019516 [Mikania micrantha]
MASIVPTQHRSQSQLPCIDSGADFRPLSAQNTLHFPAACRKPPPNQNPPPRTVLLHHPRLALSDYLRLLPFSHPYSIALSLNAYGRGGAPTACHGGRG